MDDSYPKGDSSSPELGMNPSSGLCLEVPPRQASSSGLLSQRDTRKAQPSGWKVTARGMQGPGSQLLHHSPFRRGLTCQKSYSRAGQSRARLEGLLGSGAESWLLPAAFVILGTLLHCPKPPSLHLKTRVIPLTAWSLLPASCWLGRSVYDILVWQLELTNVHILLVLLDRKSVV